MSEFVEVKTAELVGPALDWAMAKAEGMTAHVAIDGNIYASAACWIRNRRFCAPGASEIFKPSIDWAQGGPLRDKYKVDVTEGDHAVSASILTESCECMDASGPTALIAMCRAIVAAKLGDVAQVPAELVGVGA